MAEARPAWVRRWQTALSDAPAQVRLQALLEGPDAMALIRSLPAEDLYVVIREVGVADSADVIAKCSPEQLQSFLDLDAWRSDRFQPERYGPWVLALRRGGCRDIARILAQIDPEVQALALKGYLAIQELEEDEDPDPPGTFIMDTPDRRYRVSAMSDDESVLQLVQTQLGAMLANGPLHLSAYLSQLTWELPAQLEEEAYRFRRARLQDLGFPDPEEARVLEAPLPSVDAALAEAAGPLSRSPDSAFQRALMVRRGDGPGALLHRALAGISDARIAARVAQDLVHLTNSLLVLWGVDPGETSYVRQAAAGAMAMVELTLRKLAPDDVGTATAVLSKTPVRTLYRIAVTLLHGPSQRAHKLLEIADRLPELDEPFLQALAARPPRQVDGAPFSDPLQAGMAECRVAGLEDLAGWLDGVTDPITALQAYGSVVVRRNLGLGDDVAPVSKTQLAEFLQRYDDSLFGNSPGLGDQRLRAEWEGLWGQDPADLDPRFVGGVWMVPDAQEPS